MQTSPILSIFKLYVPARKITKLFHSFRSSDDCCWGLMHKTLSSSIHFCVVQCCFDFLEYLNFLNINLKIYLAFFLTTTTEARFTIGFQKMILSITMMYVDFLVLFWRIISASFVESKRLSSIYHIFILSILNNFTYY